VVLPLSTFYFDENGAQGEYDGEHPECSRWHDDGDLVDRLDGERSDLKTASDHPGRLSAKLELLLRPASFICWPFVCRALLSLWADITSSLASRKSPTMAIAGEESMQIWEMQTYRSIVHSKRWPGTRYSADSAEEPLIADLLLRHVLIAVENASDRHVKYLHSRKDETIEHN